MNWIFKNFLNKVTDFSRIMVTIRQINARQISTQMISDLKYNFWKL